MFDIFSCLVAAVVSFFSSSVTFLNCLGCLKGFLFSVIDILDFAAGLRDLLFLLGGHQAVDCCAGLLTGFTGPTTFRVDLRFLEA